MNHELSQKFFTDHFIKNYVQKSHVFAFSCSSLGFESVKKQFKDTVGELSFLSFKPKYLWDYYKNENYYYIDHHQSHAAYAFLTSGYKQSDIIAIDGGGFLFNAIFIRSDGLIIDLSKSLRLGTLWSTTSICLGLGHADAGKAMGLAGYGKFNESAYKFIMKHLKNNNFEELEKQWPKISHVPNEDIASTVQFITEQLIKKYIYPLKTSNNVCISGGVAYNGYLNEMLTKHYENVHVPPAVGDEGQSLGTYMHADYNLNKNIHIPNTYSGNIYEVDSSDLEGLDFKVMNFEDIAKIIAQEIANGGVIGFYQDRSESGNRALGNRSILADPRNPNIKNIINSTIKKREDFRPFAPSVLEEHYNLFFKTNQNSPNMSRIVEVISDKVPGITHVDNTARIQTVSKKDNHKFYTVINEFYKLTGIPMLLNTSFNCQEPIVETPLDAIKTFKNTELNVLVLQNYIIYKNK